MHALFPRRGAYHVRVLTPPCQCVAGHWQLLPGVLASLPRGDMLHRCRHSPVAVSGFDPAPSGFPVKRQGPSRHDRVG